MAHKAKLTDHRQIIGKPQRRAYALQREAMKIDEQARTVELAFASDAPIEHWFGTVILDHSKDAVMLDRLLSNGPLLDNHDTDKQLGAVREASTDGHVSRALVQFSKRSSAQDVFQDVLDEICRSVSVGFVIHELVLEESNETTDIYRATKWEPVEISMVPVPADTSVGVGRALDTDLEQPTAADPDSVTEPTPTETSASRTIPPTIEKRNAMEDENVTTPEMTRANEISALGGLLGEVELARDFIADEGKTPAEFKAAVKAKRTAAQAQTQVEDPATVAQRNGGQPLIFSRHAKLKHFKGQDAEKRAHRFGMFLIAGPLGRSIDSPVVQKAREFCRSNGIVLTRAHTESVNEDGGFMVPTEFGNDLIDLREEFGVFRPNTRVVPMISDTKSEPRRTGGLTAYPVGETKQATESKKGWDRVSLVAKKWIVLAKYSTELSEDSVINIGDFLSVKGRLPGYVWKRDTPKWYCHQTFWTEVMEKLALAAGGVSAAEIIRGATNGQPTFLGQPVEITQAMPHADANSQIPVVFGSLRLGSMLGDRRGVTVSMTDSNDTDFEQDLMSIKGTTRYDIVVHDVGNASATASQRVPGPIVGLISASS